MFDYANILIIGQKELREALRNRWFVLFTFAFAGLSMALSSLSQPELGQMSLSNYSRTSASLINLVLLFIPLIGLVLGSSGLASERETGALDYLLSQPVNHAEVLIGKYLGMACALLASLIFGFGTAAAAMAISNQAGNPTSYLITVALASLLALAMLSIGFLISVSMWKLSTALTSSLFVWLAFVFIGDLGIMGAAIITQMPISTLFWISIINPLQMFKMAAILNIQADLEVLGPVGMYATEQYGEALLPILILGLILWAIVPLGLALMQFSDRITLRRITL